MKTFTRVGLLACGAALTWTCALFGLIGCRMVSNLCDRLFLDPPFVRSAWPGRSYDHITSRKKRERARTEADRPRRRNAIRLLNDALAKYALDHGRCPASKLNLIADGYISAADAARLPDNSVAFVCSIDEERRLTAAVIPLIVTQPLICGNYEQ